MKRVLLVLSTVLALFAGCSQVQKSEKDEKSSTQEESKESTKDTVTLEIETQRSIGLQVEAVRNMPIAESIDVTAVVKPNETRVAPMKPLSRGRVIRVQVRAGDRVHSGQGLVVYDNVEAGELLSEYRSGTATLDKASAVADVTQRSLERAESLVGVGAIAKAEVERRSAEYKNALASIAVAKADLDKISEKLRRFGLENSDVEKFSQSPANSRLLAEITLRAPFDGVITAANVAEGEVIDPGDDLLTITDISTVWVQGDVYDRDLRQVRSGQTVEIVTDAYPDEVFKGRLTYISDFLDPQTRTAKIRCEVPNPKGALKLDMFARIHLQSSGVHNALAVPQTAVQTIDGKTYVFARKDETTFERKEITLGSKSGKVVEVRSGLEEGEMVVTEGSFSIKSALLKDRIGGDEK